MATNINYNSIFINEYRKDCEMKIKIALILICIVVLSEAWIVKIQADNNKHLIYDLNVSQTAFKIQSNLIADGLCLPKLEIK